MASYKFSDLLQSIQNTQIRLAIERMFSLVGVSGSTSTSNPAALTGNVTGDVTGDLTGNVTGNVTGDVTGSATKVTEATPVNVATATGTLTISSSPKHGESFVIGTETFDIHGDAVTAYAGANTEVDITGAATAAQATEILTLDGVAIDGETVTIGSDVYEFDTDGSIAGGSTIAVDVSGAATQSQGTLTLANGDLHDDTIVVAGTTTTLKADGTAGSATVIDMTVGGTYPNTLQRGVMTMNLGGVPADGETFTINARVYEFDPAGDGIGGDVEIDTNGLTTIDQVGAKIETDYNADGSRVANAVYDSASNSITFTAITAGVASNYVCSETMADSGISGNFAGGADILGTELGLLVLAHYQSGGAGAEATVLATAGVTDDKVIFTAVTAGTAGDAITTTETLTAGSFDAVTLGTTTAGVDCPKGDAQTALVASVATNGLLATQPYSFAAFAADAATLSMHNVGVEGNGVAIAYSGTNTGWTGGDGTTDGGVDATNAELETIIAALTPTADCTLAGGAGTTVVATSGTAGSVGNAIVTTEALTGCAWGAATLTGGVDGTVAEKGSIRFDGDYIYIATAANTWERAAIASF